MADGGPAGVFFHQAFVLAAMAQAKDLADPAHILVRLNELRTMGVEAAHAGRELPPVLDVQEHPRDQA